MKLISWNIDSHAACWPVILARAKLSQAVPPNLASRKCRYYSHSGNKTVCTGPTSTWRFWQIFSQTMKTLLALLPRAGPQGLCWKLFSTKELTPTVTFLRNRRSWSTMDVEASHHYAGIWLTSLSLAYTPNAGDGLKRLMTVKSGCQIRWILGNTRSTKTSPSLLADRWPGPIGKSTWLIQPATAVHQAFTDEALASIKR